MTGSVRVAADHGFKVAKPESKINRNLIVQILSITGWKAGGCCDAQGENV